MFTGIVEEVGSIKQLSRRGEVMVITVGGKVIMADIHLGDSIAVNGVCLTVAAFTKESFMVEAVPETLSRSTLGQLAVGRKVNLERALKANGRLGGHFVLGHVDCFGEITRIEDAARTRVMTVKVPREVIKYLAEKGSIAIDGVSLTIAHTRDAVFSCALVPFTLEHTTLAGLFPGDRVNIECDILGKYVEKMQAAGPDGGKITEEWLRKTGF